MKLLFDQNLSPKLVKLISDSFPGSLHVREVGLQAASDIEVWRFAQSQNFTIVTKDADFGDMGLVMGFPPKVIWIRRVNCKTEHISQLLEKHKTDIFELQNLPGTGTLMLF